VSWARPEGAALDEIDERLKKLKLTIRNAPIGQSAAQLGKCIFTGVPAVVDLAAMRDGITAITARRLKAGSPVRVALPHEKAASGQVVGQTGFTKAGNV